MPSKKTPAIKAKKELPEIPKELVERLGFEKTLNLAQQSQISLLLKS
ncbi:hypothetical protein PSEUDO8Z_30126 [Pseudomonas sp. 8Z]|nr:hypothetical protein [Pseudomonas sp. 8Z]VXC92713.1 hypothetical protein PSEUDO8Z_30126 [Pseudomonas sp. 8Z]